jgi:hypothetical protein
MPKLRGNEPILGLNNGEINSQVDIFWGTDSSNIEFSSFLDFSE